MFKTVGSSVWAYDLEWVPDPDAGRRVYSLPKDMPDEEVIAEMWRQGGATEEDPRPYLKTILCRIVSVAAVTREGSRDRGYKLELRTLPRDPSRPMPEADLIADFLAAIGRVRPQLVGYNSANADLPILVQRGIVNGVLAQAFCTRPNKPWEGADYFAKFSESHIDLKEIISGWGKGTPSLHEFATASRVPGKMGTSGDDVVGLWSQGKIREIVEYNEYDAITTYLVWLRTAHFAGFFDDAQYTVEQDRVRALLADRIASGGRHLEAYRQKWEALQG